jgi:hypothetical protein
MALSTWPLPALSLGRAARVDLQACHGSLEDGPTFAARHPTDSVPGINILRQEQ